MTSRNDQKIDSLDSLKGLSEEAAIAIRAEGRGNNVELRTGRSYLQIFQQNLFTFINMVFFAITVVMILLGRSGDAFLVVVVIFGSVVISIFQEIWAKHKLDKIALLKRPHVTVLRDGQEKTIDQGEVVLGDLLVIRPGDQLVVDGVVVGTGRIEMDESLLTGESDMIPKVAGDEVFSGSFCVTGTANYKAEKVGKDTTAYQVMASAKAFRQNFTPLQQEINTIIRVFLLIACFLLILLVISMFSRSISITDAVLIAAVILGLVPVGLYIAITLAYGTGAVRMAGQNVLIQQVNAVESLSNVDILCMDKTGTLTTNQIRLQTIYPLGLTTSEVEKLLGDYATNTQAGNKTSEALAAACPGAEKPVSSEVPFSSARKWSAIAFAGMGTYVLGAPEILGTVVKITPEMHEYIQMEADQGLRVVLFTHSPQEILPPTPDHPPALPEDLGAIAILSFSDQLRPLARETLDSFTRSGIKLKIISGDNPKTVAALAKQAGLDAGEQVISGTQLAEMDDSQFAAAAVSNTVFGRITPEQKAQLVKKLRQQGFYVAMTGDGVNDVLSLKQANLGIAMESGSQATRGVADIILLNDSFGSLPKAFLEGQRIRNALQDALKLFIVRGFVFTLLIFCTGMVTQSFPLNNKHSSLLALLGVGLPTMLIPLWAKPGHVNRGSVVRSQLHFVLSATLTLTLVALLVYFMYIVKAVLDLPPNADPNQVNLAAPRSALVTIVLLCQMLLVCFLKPPLRIFAGGEPYNGDWRYIAMAVGIIAIYAVILAVPGSRNFFELELLSKFDYLFLALVALEWGFILRWFWRTRIFDRFLGVNLSQ